MAFIADASSLAVAIKVLNPITISRRVKLYCSLAIGALRFPVPHS